MSRVNAGNLERLLWLATRIVKRASNSDKAKENLHHDTPTTREADFEISKALTSGMYSLIFLKLFFKRGNCDEVDKANSSFMFSLI